MASYDLEDRLIRFREYHLSFRGAIPPYTSRTARRSPTGSQQHIDLCKLRGSSIRRVSPRLRSQTRDLSEGIPRDANLAQIHSPDGFLIRVLSRSSAAGV